MSETRIHTQAKIQAEWRAAPRRTRRPLLAAMAVALALPASLHAMTLQQAYQAALQHDPQYQAARYARDAGAENAVLGRAGLLPVISASGSRNKNKADITTQGVNGARSTRQRDYTSESAVLQLRQPILNLENYARYRGGLAQANIAAYQFKTQADQLTLRLVTAYVEALYANEQLRLAQAQRDAYAEQKKVNDRLLKQGEGTVTDRLETQAKLDMAEAQLLEAQDAVLNAREALATIVGGDPGELTPLSDNFNAVVLDPATFEEWRDLAVKNSASIAAATYAVEFAGHEVLRARAGHAPRIDFVASLSKSKSETITTLDQDYKTKSVGVQLNVPLYAGGQVSALTRQAVANKGRAQAELDAESDKTLLEVRKQFNLMKTGRSRIDAFRQAVASGSLLVEATQKSIKGGVRINLDLLNAQQQLYMAQRDLSQARFNYLLSYLRLRAAAGQLAATDLDRIASYFR